MSDCPNSECACHEIPNLRAALAVATAQLEEAKKQLEEFDCPICGGSRSEYQVAVGRVVIRDHQIIQLQAQLAEARELLRQTRVLLAGTGIANRIAAFLARTKGESK